MDIKSLVSIAGYDLPMPSSYRGNTATIVDSARNVDGVMIGAVIRDDVAKVEMSWKFLSTKEWSEILKLFDIKSGGKFINRVTFFDQVTGEFVSRDMYVNDRNANMFRVTEKDGVLGWLEPSLNLIEV